MSADKFYHSKAWRKLRLAVIYRDKHQCQECKRQGRLESPDKYGTVHHKIPREIRHDLSLDINNCEYLCRSCHERIEGRKKDSGHQQFLREWNS